MISASPVQQPDGRRPPQKPPGVPFSQQQPHNNNNTSSSSHSHRSRNNSNNIMRDVSESSRTLRQHIAQRRSSLTRAEEEYLNELCHTGNDADVQVAHQVLLDEELFFAPHNSDNNNGTVSNSIGIQKGGLKPAAASQFRSDSAGSGLDLAALPNLLDGASSRSLNTLRSVTTASTVHTTTIGTTTMDTTMDTAATIDTVHTTNNNNHCSMNMGSERRQLLLRERRRQNQPLLWKAHESGLAVSTHASARSVVSRQWRQSTSETLTSRRGLYHRSDIFRTHLESGGAGALDRSNLSSNNSRRRRTSWGNQSLNHMSSLGIAAAGRRQRSSSVLMTQSMGRPVLRRMLSEGGRRKSVSFKDLPTLTIEELEGEGSPKSVEPHPLNQSDRAVSDLSFASLRSGHPISSPTSQSVPSLHQAHSISSARQQPFTSSGRYGSVGSLASTPSLHMAQSIYSDTPPPPPLDDGDDREEKKTDEPMPTLVVPDSSARLVLMDATKVLRHDDSDDGAMEHEHTTGENTDPPLRVRPVFLRKASRNMYHGEGIEVTPTCDESIGLTTATTTTAAAACTAPETITKRTVPIPPPVRFFSRDASSEFDALTSKLSLSFDETKSTQQQNMSHIFRLRRSLSDDLESSLTPSLSNGIVRGAVIKLRDTSSLQDTVLDDDVSWNLDEEIDDMEENYDSWKVIEDEYCNGYGGGGTLPFLILGTNADDVDAHPHVLSPPLMESLLEFLPVAKSGDNYWMKYSMVRDGASLHTFLQHARGAQHSVLAIETVDGEVFGAYTGEAWRKNWNHFGNGESFLWKMRQNRRKKCHSIIDQAHMESEIDVYPYTGVNNCVQLCTHNKIAVGGGNAEPASSTDLHNDNSKNKRGGIYEDYDWGFGITIENDFLHGTTSPCLTFGSPSLSIEHPDGSLFEIMNLELWTLTPCFRVEDAEKLELGNLFLAKHTN